MALLRLSRSIFDLDLIATHNSHLIPRFAPSSVREGQLWWRSCERRHSACVRVLLESWYFLEAGLSCPSWGAGMIAEDLQRTYRHATPSRFAASRAARRGRSRCRCSWSPHPRPRLRRTCSLPRWSAHRCRCAPAAWLRSHPTTPGFDARIGVPSMTLLAVGCSSPRSQERTRACPKRTCGSDQIIRLDHQICHMVWCPAPPGSRKLTLKRLSQAVI